MPPKRPRRPEDPELPRERTADNAYLYNEDLYGLNPKLDFRTRLIIGCFVTDSVASSTVRSAFATACVYPPSAVEEIKKGVSVQDGGGALRKSSRLTKDAAARAIEDLGQRAKYMSSGEVILAAADIVDTALNADRYLLRPMEDLTGKKKSKAADTASSAKSVDKAPHKRVVGYFPPASSKEVSESLALEKQQYEMTHLFVCRCVWPTRWLLFC
jgi:hypothetical protein